MINLNNMEEWRSFKEREWRNYSFIEPILQQYYQKWLERGTENFEYR